MSVVVSIIKNQKIIIAVGFILLIVMVLAFGSWAGLDLTTRLLISCMILFVWVIVMLFIYISSTRNSSNIEKSMKAQAESQKMNMRPEKREEIEQFQKQLEAAIESLKKSKLGKGISGKSALYALPWYMFIGPPAAGKTTVIQNSGLEFPIGENALKGIGGTKNCDWFFANRAIFLDTAGRYTISTEDKEEWLAFLDILKKNRKKKPINGVIVGINIDELINADDQKVELHANNIRKRIYELIDQLGVRFPVYLVFTKCDLINGFVETFGNLTKLEREQILGCTISKEKQSKLDSETIYKEECRILHDNLKLFRDQRLSNPLKREERRKVYLFPIQFKDVTEKLSGFVGKLFQSNPYQDSPIFRGFYFTSGTQEGVPLDVAIQKIARQFDLPPLMEDAGDNNLEVKHYFIRTLFSDVVIGDKDYLVGKTSRIAKQGRILRYAMMGLTAIALGLFILGISNEFIGSQSEISELSDNIENVKNLRWDGDLLKNFQKADELRANIEEIENASEASLVNFGLHRRESLLISAKALYYSKMGDFLNQHIYSSIDGSLKEFLSGNGPGKDKIYKLLQVYLLLGNEKARINEGNKKTIKDEMNSVFSGNLLQMIPVSSARESLRAYFDSFNSYFVNHINDPGIPLISNNGRLIQQVRNLVREKPTIDGVYQRIIRTGSEEYPGEYNLSRILGAGSTAILKSDYSIPVIYTMDGWNSYVESAIGAEVNNPGKEDWVVGGFDKENIPAEMRDQKTMQATLEKLYFRDYSKQWWNLLGSLKYESFGNTSTAVNKLQILADPVSSPLFVLLKKVTEQTTFENDFGDTAADVLGKTKKGKTLSLLGLSYEQQGHPVDNQFRELHNFVNGTEGSGQGKILLCFEQYNLLSSALESIKSDPSECKNYCVSVIQQKTGEFPMAKRAVTGSVYSLPQLKNLFELPVNLAWNSVLSDAQFYLNSQWESVVYNSFRKNLDGFYPFKRGGLDAPLDDFSAFFNPNDGIFWTFYQQELSPFIDRNGWKVNRWENSGINFSSQTIRVFNNISNISETMFDNGSLGVNFKLKPKLPVSAVVNNQKPIVEQIYINIDGTEISYKMGSAFWTDFTWPGNKGRAGSKLLLSVHGFGSIENTFEGDWSLFKLLSAGSIKKESSSLFNVNWYYKKENQFDIIVSYQLQASSSRNPFTGGFFESLNIPRNIN